MRRTAVYIACVALIQLLRATEGLAVVDQAYAEGTQPPPAEEWFPLAFARTVARLSAEDLETLRRCVETARASHEAGQSGRQAEESFR